MESRAGTPATVQGTGCKIVKAKVKHLQSKRIILIFLKQEGPLYLPPIWHFVL